MTVVEAISEILSKNNRPMTSKEIYESIIKENLYEFNSKNPLGIVRSAVRRHCVNLVFPTAMLIKYFIMVYKRNNTCYYALANYKGSKMGSVIEDSENSDMLPEERMQEAYNVHIRELKVLILDTILSASPSFFEHLVVELLLAMGYGYDKNSGIVVGSTNDAGIDGIIYEDKLGLSKIYIQAKRYSLEKSVGRPVLQGFSGAMQSVVKGVFITTSKYTKLAREFVECEQQKSIKLIDGTDLVDLMIRYEVGVTVTDIMKTYKLDENYFVD